MLKIAKYRYDVADKDCYLLIKKKVTDYFRGQRISRYANTAVLLKIVFLTILSIVMYISMLWTNQIVIYGLCFFVFLASTLILGMTVGHDAAHQSLTGKRSWDNLIFQIVFMINGINPEPWKDKHNKSHHSFPNVQDYDSDMELSQLIYLSGSQQKSGYHRFQHLYAPFLYLFFTLGWIYYFDFVYHFKKNQGNLTMPYGMAKLPKIIAIKVIHTFICLGIPILFGHLNGWLIIAAFFVCHALVSLFLSFTFFMSHHVMETHYTEVLQPNVINSSWLRHQIDTTIDFHGESAIANFFFGGFHAHTAHHLFPGVCHIHYPKLTSIIRETLEENGLNYKSLTFHQGVISHLRLLKHQGLS